MSTPKTIKIDNEEYIRKADIKVKYKVPSGEKDNPFFEVGKDYFIRTVTHYFTGRLVWVGQQELAFEQCCWIADTGRFHQFVAGGSPDESEPFLPDSIVVISRSALIDLTERKGGLILTQK